MRVGCRNVRDNLMQPQRLSLDLRSPEEYSGERVSDYSFKVDHGAERTGRIPGAVHVYFKDLLNEAAFVQALPASFVSTLARPVFHRKNSTRLSGYCRLSHRATIGWIALSQILGHKDVKIYDGSWTEWGSIVGYPVEK